MWVDIIKLLAVIGILLFLIDNAHIVFNHFEHWLDRYL